MKSQRNRSAFLVFTACLLAACALAMVLVLPALARERALRQVDIDQPFAWFPATRLPYPWIGPGIQCPDDPGHYYLVGGVKSGFENTADVSRYDIQAGVWETDTIADLPFSNRVPALACYQDKIYAAGGFTNGTITDSLFIYDLSSKVWTRGANLPDGIFGASLGAWEGKLYLAGGNSSGPPYFPLNSVHVYDIAADAWTPSGGISMPLGSNFGGYIQTGPYLYVVGGLSGDYSNNLNTTQRYDMSHNVWEMGPTFTSQRAMTGLAITEDYLYAMGGDANGGGDWDDATDYVERLDLAQWGGGTWTNINDPLPAAVLSPMGTCSEILTGGEIWSVGGSDTVTFYDTNLYRSTEPCLLGSYGISLEPDDLSGSGWRGAFVEYNLTITNTGDIPDAYTAAIKSIWTAAVSSPPPVWPGKSATITVTVAVPYTATLGDSDTVMLMVTSQGDPAEQESAVITTTAVTDWVEVMDSPQPISANIVQCPEQPDSFYLVGGGDDIGALDTLYRFDAVLPLGQWVPLASLPAPRGGGAAACYQGKIYVAGGMNVSIYNTLFIYDIASDTWIQGANLPSVIWGAALGAWNGKLYLVGGTRGSYPWTPVNRVDVFDIAAGIWTPAGGSPMLTPASFFGAIQRGPYLYAVGGYSTDPDQNVDQVQLYDMALNSWEVVLNFPSARSLLPIAVTSSRLYAIGGDLSPVSGPRTYTELVEYHEQSDMTGGWFGYDPLPQSLGNTNGSSACTIGMSGGEIWSVGGFDNLPPYYHDEVYYHPAEPCLSYTYTLMLAPANLHDVGRPGETVIYTMTVTNTGGMPDAYDLLVTSTWLTSSPVFVPTLDPGESTPLTIIVSIPPEALASEQDIALVEVTSQGDSSQQASTILTTTALPVNGVRLEPDQTGVGVPGETLTYTLQLTNTGNITDTFDLKYAENVWVVNLPVITTTLAPRAGMPISVLVMIPQDALADDADTITVKATSQSDPSVMDSSSLVTKALAVPGVSLEPDQTGQGLPGEIVTYTLYLTNTGNLTDTLDLVITGNQWVVTLPFSQTILAAGGSLELVVQVLVPSDPMAGDMDTAMISVASEYNPAATDSTEIITSALWWRNYLPVITND